jgi:8-oxo-dGTP pyrophosphatase MutT (NUDIX family)
MSVRAEEWLRGPRHEVVAARSAATVMILRDRAGANSPVARGRGTSSRGAASGTAASGGALLNGPGVDIFMLRRAASMAFAPRMMVFPGGGVDPRDADPSLPWAGPAPAVWGRLLVADEATARELVVAAVREVFEECGVLLAGPDDSSVVGDVSGSQWQAERASLQSHERSLAEVLIDRGLVLRSDLLRARAHWITPEFEPRRYDTRFFAALLPAGQIADDQTSEADHADWADPVSLLKEYAGGSALMLPPTVVCVEQVAAASSVADFLATDVPIEPITPVPTRVDGEVVMRCRLPEPSPGGLSPSAEAGQGILRGAGE